MVSRRDSHTGLSHQCQKTYCLEGNCLTTGVRSGDYQHIEIFSHINIDGNNLLFIDKRMSSLLDVDGVILVKGRNHAVYLKGIGCLGKNEIKLRHNIGVKLDVIHVLRNPETELLKDLFDLSLLLQGHLSKLVVELYNCRRLNKKS